MHNRGTQVEFNMTKYEVIKKEIKEQIEDNILKPNQVIASENEMCRHYDVSRVTVRKAIDELCAEGILYRIKGKGCFVRELKFTYLQFHGSCKERRKNAFEKAVIIENDECGCISGRETSDHRRG